MKKNVPNSYGFDLEWHDTPQLWVAYRGCGCAECPKGYGKTKEEAIAELAGSAYRETLLTNP